MKSSSILLLKSKFFLYRVLTYFAFLLVPIWLQKSLHLNPGIQGLMMIPYIFFIVGQWFLLGKEIDHRFKIYFRVNSSMDRVIYRLVLGMISLTLYFNLLHFIPAHILKHFFWGTWVLMGIFYSWPTRGKIIQESVTSQLGEFKFLDNFEKTVLGLIILFFVVSIPMFPSLEDIEALKLYFDPLESFHSMLWNFLSVNYFPFKKFPLIFRMAWSMHFYVVGMGMFLLSFYALLRFFVSRRLSILGVFAVISSWSYSLLLGQHLSISITTTFSVIWIWSLLWVSKSSTYRSGIFIGMLGIYGAMINPLYYILMFVQVFCLHFFFHKEKTLWYRKQVMKYSLFGFVIAGIIFFNEIDNFHTIQALELDVFLEQISLLIKRKAFFVLSIFGFFILMFFNFFNRSSKYFPSLMISDVRVSELIIGLLLLFICAMMLDENLYLHFSLMWILTFLSLVPLEWIFQSISRLRSKRNLFYAIYILICLLDSHLDQRIKNFAKIF